MLVLGLILILIAVAAVVTVLVSGTDEQSALFGGSVQLPTLVVFLAGAAALLLFMVGLGLVRSGLGREVRRRKDARRLRKLERREADRHEAHRHEGTADSSAPNGTEVEADHTGDGSPDSEG